MLPLKSRALASRHDVVTAVTPELVTEEGPESTIENEKRGCEIKPPRQGQRGLPGAEWGGCRCLLGP